MPTATTIHPVGERSPLRELLAVAGPAIVTMLSPAMMQFVDAVLVARLGPTAVAAQGNGALASFVVMNSIVGLLSVVNTFAAQNHGAGRFDRCGRYGWTALWISAVCAALVFPLSFVLEDAFRLIGHGQGGGAARDLLELETTYGGILLAFAVLPACAARGLGQFFYGVHRPMVVLTSTIAGNAVNLAASYALIFGVAGLPAMGVAGAAVGTVIGHGTEIAILLAVFLSRRFDSIYRTRSVWRPSLRAVREVVALGWPVSLHYGNELACWALFLAWVVPSAVAPAEAPAVIAASVISLNWMKLGFLPVVGLSFGVTAVVGAQIGKGNRDAAAHRAMLGLGLGMLYMAIVGVAMFFLREPMTAVFVESEGRYSDPVLDARTLEAGAKILALMAVFQAFDAVGIVMSGALRGAGDTTWPGVVVVVSAWTILIGGGLLVGRLFPDLGALGPWLAGGSYLAISGAALLLRFRAGRWRSFELLDPAPAATGLPLAGPGPETP